MFVPAPSGELPTDGSAACLCLALLLAQGNAASQSAREVKARSEQLWSCKLPVV